MEILSDNEFVPGSQFVMESLYERTVKKLFRSAEEGKWEEVKYLYRNFPGFHGETIPGLGATALHVAVSDGQEPIVEELVKSVCEAANISAFRIQDTQGNNILHTAAALGSVKMCKCISSKFPPLIGARNDDGETPLFLAALGGHMDAFLCLHSLCGAIAEAAGYSYIRRNDGDTILHCAIAGDYFDLALQIIHLYPDLSYYSNERGQSALHLLAAKPAAFRSCSQLGGFSRVIYDCIHVDETFSSQLKSKSTLTHQWPENYETCCNFINIVKEMIKAVIRRGSRTQTGGAGNNEVSKGNSATGGDTSHIGTSGGSEKTREKDGDIEDTPGGKLIAGDPDSQSTNENGRRHQLFPPNFATIFEFVKLVSKGMFIILCILGLGSNEIKKIRESKQKHTWALQLLGRLVDNVATYDFENYGRKPKSQLRGSKDLPEEPMLPDLWSENQPYQINFPTDSAWGDLPANTAHEFQKDGTKANKEVAKEIIQEMAKIVSPLSVTVKSGSTEVVQKIQIQFPVMNQQEMVSVKNMQENAHAVMSKRETPILIAAMNGITEIVQKILNQCPAAVHDVNSDKKNIVLLAVENRQSHIYELLLQMTTLKGIAFRKVDGKGNSALHLAAMLGDSKPWPVSGEALQMHCEIKWHEFVENSMPPNFFVRYNKENKTAKDIFTETHKDLVKGSGQWLINTSQSCSVVASLIATVAFATSATVPGGIKGDNGTPNLENQPAFIVFAVSSLVALSFSVASVVMFLSILTSRYEEQDFKKNLPNKLVVGLISLLISMVSMLVSFCSGHFFVLRSRLNYAALPLYAAVCLPVAFAISQFPLYSDTVKAVIRKRPPRVKPVLYGE